MEMDDSVLAMNQKPIRVAELERLKARLWMQRVKEHQKFSCGGQDGRRYSACYRFCRPLTGWLASLLCLTIYTLFSSQKNSCVIKMERNSVGIGKRTDVMYAVDFKMFGEQSFAVLGTDASVFSVRNARFAEADRHTVSWSANEHDFRNVEMRQLSILGDCSSCIEGTMTNMPMPSCTHVESGPGAVTRNDIAVMDIFVDTRSKVHRYPHQCSAWSCVGFPHDVEA